MPHILNAKALLLLVFLFLPATQNAILACSRSAAGPTPLGAIEVIGAS